MERIKRAVSLILCFVMVFGLLPMHAFAAEGETEPVNDITTQVEPMAETGSKTATGNLKGETTTVYTLTNTLNSGNQYLIVSRNSAGSGTALGSSTTGQTVTVENGNVITDKGNAVEWTATSSSNGWSFSNGSSYLGYTQNENGNFFSGFTYTYELNPTGDNSTWTVNGSSLYINLQTSGRGIMGGSEAYADHYLVPGSTWSMSTSSSSANVYFYEKSESSTPGAEVELTVNKDQVDLLVGKKETLTTTVEVAGTATTDHEITWASSNPDVATVENGVITAKAAGSTKITAKLTKANDTEVNGTVQVEITVNVSAVTLTDISVSNTEGITTCVHKDADFSGVIVTATYSDESQVELTEGVTFTYEKAVGEQTVTVTYDDMTATFPITVQETVVTGKTLSGPAVFTFGQGTNAVFSGLTVQYTYACGCTEENPSGLNVSGYNVNVPGTYKDCPVMLDGEQLGTVTVIINEYTPVVGEGNLVGSYVYTLDTDGINAGEKYLIVNTGSNDNGSALNNSGSGTPVTISGSQITVADDTSIAWIFSGSTRGTVKNGTNRYIYLGSNSLVSTSSRDLVFSRQSGGAYRIYRDSSPDYYVRYNNGWQRSTTTSNVYLYRQTGSTKGDAVVFTIDRDSLTLKPGQSTALNATVTLNGQNVALGNCAIDWASNNSYASVSGGNVTGNAEGTSVITATLTAVKGEALASPISLNVTVKVQEVAVANAYLTGNGPREVSLGEAPDFSNIKYVINYADNTQKVIDAAHLTFDSCDVTTSGNKVVGIYYNAEHVGNVMVTVTADFSKLDPAINYPEYPNNGAVRINKFASHTVDEFNRTGVTRVELDVAGISVEDAVDVILIMDISNSMSWNDVNQEFSDAYDPNDPNERLNIAKASAQEFVKELMKDNGDNDPNTVDNTLTMLAFAGIDGDYNDHSTAADNDDVFQIGDLAMSSMDEATAALNELRKAKTGGTNYDYAFQQAYTLAQQLYAERGNRVYIVFMTDGVPTHYNGVYYKNRTNTDLTAKMFYVDPETGEQSRYTSNDYDRDGNLINKTATTEITFYPGYGKESATKTVTYNKGWSDYVMNNKNDWAEKVKDLDYVAHVYAIGFGMKNGSVTESAGKAMPDANGGQYYIPSFVTHATLQHIASDANSHFEADDVEALSNLYRNIASQIKFAGTEARVTDIVDQNFSVQMENNVYDKNGNPIALNTPPSITIKTYDLYPRGSVDAAGHDITGKRTGTSADIETVTFAMVNGKLQAYSSVIGSRVNILTTDAAGNITISAKYFTYTKEAATSAEKFVWTIGNITDKEIALAFDAYLEGSMQGLRPQDVYYTNEEAVLEYVDINGKYAKQIFPIPGVAWGGASTTIRFYLVNEKGEPVNRSGKVIPWENRIYVGEPVVVALNLNADLTIDAQKIEAAAHVPAQFFLYDINAYYTVQTTSSTEAIAGGIIVSEPSDDARKTTGEAPNAVTQTGAQTTRVISAEEEYYTWSYVGFGVRWDLSAEPTEYVLTPDQIVIDYGKAIQVDVLANDVTRNEYNRELVGFIKYTAGSDLGYVMENPGSATFSAEYGNFSIVDGKVQFQPTKIINKVQRVFYAVKYTEKQNTNNFYYVWGQLDIIPATIVYYETDFATGVFTTKDTWEIKASGNGADGPQNDGTIGQNTYGFDTTYNNDNLLSNGTSQFAKGQGYTKTNVTFSFTGTGFDLISRTGTEQGLIQVQVATDANFSNIIKTVSVLNKSETNLELYQIPVASINGLEHGTYYVMIGVNMGFTAPENMPALEALNRGNEFYFDAIRIYDPAKGNSIAEAAYEADGEANNSLDEVRALLLNAETYKEIAGTTTGMVFIDRTQTNAEIATYQTIGPNNEVYLSKDQAVAFKVKANSIPASFDIGAKSITGSTAGLKVTIRNADGSKFWTVTEEIKSSTVQFIDLLKATGADASLLNQGAYVVITNTGDGVLSITDIKTAFRVADTAEVDTASVQDPYGISLMTANAADPYAVSFTVDSNILSVARSVLENPVEPEEPKEPTEPEVDASMYDIISASVKKNGSKKNVKYTITVVTTMEVDKITVSQGSYELKASKISYKDKTKNGTREWTIVLTSNVSDLYDCFTLIGADENGITGNAFNVSKPR